MGLATFGLDGAVATITMDDGKVNALALRMLDELNGCLDRAEADALAVVLTGRQGVFSAGFDLSVLMGGGPEALAMLRGGFELAHRLLSFPKPVLIVCTGHAIAMGSFLLLSGDHRIGTTGSFKINSNEVAIGLTMPWAAIEICRARLTPAYFERAVVAAEPFDPQGAVAAGYLDQIAEPEAFQETVRTTAAALAMLNMEAHVATKLRARGPALDAIRAAIEKDDADLRVMTA